MECKDCAESENGNPAQACCPSCLEETFEHRRASAAFKGHGVRYDTGKCRLYYNDPEEHIVEVEPPGPRRALVRADKLTTVMQELAEEKAMCTKLAEALKLALELLTERRLMNDCLTERYYLVMVDEEKAVESAIKEWEESNAHG
jgi:hypothetical protein